MRCFYDFPVPMRAMRADFYEEKEAHIFPARYAAANFIIFMPRPHRSRRG